MTVGRAMAILRAGLFQTLGRLEKPSRAPDNPEPVAAEEGRE